MIRGNKLVEQVDRQGAFFLDFDRSLSVDELYQVIQREFSFAKIHKEDGMICGKYKECSFAIRVKNITYLGKPHPIYKKRIQIPNDFPQFYKKAMAKGYKHLLMGIYSSGEHIVFCDFHAEDYIGNMANNSSAHVYTEDLADACIYGYFQKKDYFGNTITTFVGKTADYFFDEIFSQERIQIYPAVPTIMPFKGGMEERLHTIQDSLFSFFKREAEEWNGVQCYQQMIHDNYRNRFQPEWAGFYLEYRFEKYIQEKSLQRLFTYAQEKGANGIDLDLYFPTLNAYGDLKAHTFTSRGIQGNDLDTIAQVLYSGEWYHHIYYVVVEHLTYKDSDYGYEVTQFWNRMQKKENLMSYSKKMKHHVILQRMLLLDINPQNASYLSVFRQGINSNGKNRAPKIMIDTDKLNHFIVAEICKKDCM